jgi:Flp pilus assembly pilin Flp
MKKHQHQTGQALAEMVLIGGLVSIASIGALSVMAPALSGKLNTMWGYFGAGGNSTPGGGGGGGAGGNAQANGAANAQANANVNGNAGGGNTVVPAAAAGGLGQVPTSIQGNLQLMQAYQALQNGTANMTEVSGSYGNLANTNYALAEQLQAQAEAVRASNPSQAASLGDLAKQIKVLAGWQAAVVTEARSAANNGLFDSSGEAYDLMTRIARETGTAINNVDTGGNLDFSSTANGRDPNNWDISNAAAATNQQAALVASMWQQVQQAGGTTPLNAADANTVTTAADNTVTNSNVYTTGNANDTYNNGQAIGNVATGGR